jgi:hypothetical protein
LQQSNSNGHYILKNVRFYREALLNCMVIGKNNYFRKALRLIFG